MVDEFYCSQNLKKYIPILQTFKRVDSFVSKLTRQSYVLDIKKAIDQFPAVMWEGIGTTTITNLFCPGRENRRYTNWVVRKTRCGLVSFARVKRSIASSGHEHRNKKKTKALVGEGLSVEFVLKQCLQCCCCLSSHPRWGTGLARVFLVSRATVERTFRDTEKKRTNCASLSLLRILMQLTDGSVNARRY